MRNRTCIQLYFSAKTLEVTHLSISQEPPNWSLQLENKKSLWILKNYKNIRIIPAILGNGTVILLYSKDLKHPAPSSTSQYMSKKPQFVLWNWEKKFIESGKVTKINTCNTEIWKFHSTIFQGPKTTHPEWHTSLRV